MKWAEKKEIRYGVAAIGIGVLAFGLYRLYRHFRSPTQQGLNSSISNNDGDDSIRSASFISQTQEHCPYE